MAIKQADIDPTSTYSVSEAARMIMGRGGRPMHPVTLAAWCRAGRVEAARIGSHWAIKGSEIIRLRDGKQSPQPVG